MQESHGEGQAGKKASKVVMPVAEILEGIAERAARLSDVLAVIYARLGMTLTSETDREVAEITSSVAYERILRAAHTAILNAQVDGAGVATDPDCLIYVEVYALGSAEKPEEYSVHLGFDIGDAFSVRS